MTSENQAKLLEDVILGEMELRPAITFRDYTPGISTLGDMPLIPTHDSRSVSMCESGKEDE